MALAFDAHAITNYAAGTTPHVNTGVTTAENNEMLVSMYGCDGSGANERTYSAYDGGQVERIDLADDLVVSGGLAMATEVIASAGATGTRQATPSTGDDGRGIEVAIKGFVGTPTFISKSGATDADGGAIVVTAPAGIQDGDMLVAFALSQDPASTWDEPAGWTAVALGGGTSVEARAYTQVAASESGDYTFTESGGVGPLMVGIIVLRDVAAGQPLARRMGGVPFTRPEPRMPGVQVW